MAKSVFLTVPELAADATPKIEVVGDVQDAGGTSLDLEEEETSIIAGRHGWHSAEAVGNRCGRLHRW